MFDPINIILLFVVVFYFIFAYFLFRRGIDRAVIYSYLFVIFSAITWTLAMIIYRGSTPENSLFWCTILYVVAILPSSSFYFFSLVFPYGKLPNFRKIFWIFFVSISAALLVIFPGIIIKGVEFYSGREKVIIWGGWYFLYFLYVSGIIVLGLINLLKKYLEERGVVKVQLKYIFWGYFIGSGMAMFPNLLLPWLGYFKINWMGQVFGTFTVALTVYAIIVHRLMDIKLVMRRYSVHLVSLSLILIVSVIIKYFIEVYYADYSVWFDIFILLISISVYPAVKNYFYHLANKYFFSSLYNSSEVIATLSEKLRSTLEAEKIYEYIYQTLSNAFHVKAFGVLTHNEEGNFFILQYNQGFEIDSRTDFLKDEKLDEMFIKQNKTIITEEVRRLTSFEKNLTVDLLLKLKVEILAPLNVKDKTIGLIALGPKESGDMYNEEDLKVLEVVGAQAAISLENALLYKETKNFSIKLEKEVEKATRDLRRANTQLKKLDAAKSEFISIASHQLRTPLTVIKGYISMMLEGNFGALTKLETESLEKVFLSNERLIQLVENLLNISRIESGRLQFDFKEVDLNNMVESVIEELSGNAKKKGLILQYKSPTKILPKIKIDDEKIRQVIMNLVDNAIKYTKQGSITVKLEQHEKKIKFSVADSGMGVRPEDMINLFKKFSRGTGTSLVHTEGTGLGLYVARMMIAAHKGKIWAESNGEGKGSKFCFELPVK